MTDRRVRVLLDLVASGFQAGARAAKQSTDDLVGSLQQNEQAAYSHKDEAAHRAGMNPERTRQWTAWTRDEGPPSTT